MSVAVRVPVAVGVKVTLKTQPEVARWLHVSVSAKSPAFAPVKLTVIGTAAPEFVSVTGWEVLVDVTTWPVNVNVVGDRLTTGVASPVPVRLTFWVF